MPIQRHCASLIRKTKKQATYVSVHACDECRQSGDYNKGLPQSIYCAGGGYMIVNCSVIHTLTGVPYTNQCMSWHAETSLPSLQYMYWKDRLQNAVERWASVPPALPAGVDDTCLGQTTEAQAKYTYTEVGYTPWLPLRYTTPSQSIDWYYSNAYIQDAMTLLFHSDSQTQLMHEAISGSSL